MQELIDKINEFVPLSGDTIDYLKSISKERGFKKGESLIHQGQHVNKTYFVLNGCLRSYCIDQDGKEHTLQFAVKDWWISDFIAIYNSELASLTVEAVTNCEVIEFNAEKLNKIHEKHPDFDVFYRHKLEKHIVSLHKRILNQLQLTALERYKLFLKQYPDIEQHTSNYHIASYLGITQQSLSRIRAERSKK